MTSEVFPQAKQTTKQYTSFLSVIVFPQQDATHRRSMLYCRRVRVRTRKRLEEKTYRGTYDKCPTHNAASQLSGSGLVK